MISFLGKTTKLVAAATLAIGLASGSASALTLSFDGWGNSFKTVNVGTNPASAVAGQYAAGGFNMKDTSAGNSFLVFCLDLLARIRSGQSYGYAETATPFTNSIDLIANGGVDRIQKLFDTGYNTALDSNIKSAGFQVALWNAVYDTDWSVANGAGQFYQTNSNGGVRAAANLFLADAQGYNGPKVWNLTFLQSTEVNPRSQNLVTAAPVPLPAAGFMLIAALGGLAAVRRRSKA